MNDSSVRTILQLVDFSDLAEVHYRMRNPARSISAQRNNWRVINLDARDTRRFEWGEHADLLLIYLSRDLDLIPLIRSRRSKNLPTLIEFSDNFYAPQPWNKIVQQWGSPLYWQAYEHLIGECDYLQVTSPALKSTFSGLKPEDRIVVLPNQLSEPPPSFDKVFRRNPEVRISWAGSTGHVSDLIAIVPALNALLSQFPQLQFHFMGHPQMLNLINIPKERMVVHPIGNLQDYYNYLSGVDIGLAPLLPIEFNRCRSDIKAVEMAAFGVLPVLQRSAAYKDFIATTDCPSFDDQDGLIEVVSKFITAPGDREAIVRELHQYVSTQRVLEFRPERGQFYESILPRNPLSFIWPIDVGFSEIKLQSRMTPSEEAVTEIGALARQGKLAEAVATCTKLLDKNEKNIEIGHLLTTLLLQQSPQGNLHDLLERFEQTHPLDLRFLLMHLCHCPEVSERIALWHRVLKRLLSNNSFFAGFFETSITQTIAQTNIFLAEHPDVVKILDQLLSIYPQNGAIKQFAAVAHLRSGNLIRARELFAEATVLHRSLQANFDCKDLIQVQLSEVWLEGLSGQEWLRKEPGYDR